MNTATNTAHHCQINTGNFVPPNNPPAWTPYAQAIADLYRVQVPLFVTVPTTLTGVALQQRTVLTQPSQYDALIFGAQIDPGDDNDSGQSVFVNLYNEGDGINW